MSPNSGLSVGATSDRLALRMSGIIPLVRTATLFSGTAPRFRRDFSWGKWPELNCDYAPLRHGSGDIRRLRNPI